MTDLLTLANHLDDTWHNQSRSFEREAITRFWGLLTMPARALDPELPRQATAARDGATQRALRGAAGRADVLLEQALHRD